MSDQRQILAKYLAKAFGRSWMSLHMLADGKPEIAHDIFETILQHTSLDEKLKLAKCIFGEKYITKYTDAKKDTDLFENLFKQQVSKSSQEMKLRMFSEINDEEVESPDLIEKIMVELLISHYQFMKDFKSPQGCPEIKNGETWGKQVALFTEDFMVGGAKKKQTSPPRSTVRSYATIATHSSQQSTFDWPPGSAPKKTKEWGGSDTEDEGLTLQGNIRLVKEASDLGDEGLTWQGNMRLVQEASNSGERRFYVSDLRENGWIVKDTAPQKPVCPQLYKFLAGTTMHCRCTQSGYSCSKEISSWFDTKYAYHNTEDGWCWHWRKQGKHHFVFRFLRRELITWRSNPNKFPLPRFLEAKYEDLHPTWFVSQ
jgi:hypothetical protein